MTHHDRRIEEDRALGDVEIAEILGISKPTLHRYRKMHGLPGPDFRVGQRTFTWRSRINEWIAQRAPLNDAHRRSFSHRIQAHGRRAQYRTQYHRFPHFV